MGIGEGEEAGGVGVGGISGVEEEGRDAWVDGVCAVASEFGFEFGFGFGFGSVGIASMGSMELEEAPKMMIDDDPDLSSLSCAFAPTAFAPPVH